ncbi:MAG: LysR family transcriptional regulator [Pseudomonadota bacterium]
MDWDKLRVFHAVADAGSLTHAGEQLHLSQSAISRQIRGLEEQLRSVLFHRHARGLLLTEQGEILYEATRSIAKRLTATAARIRDSKDEVWGSLRVTTTGGFGSLWLAPRMGSLFAQHPHLSVDLLLTETILDLPMREADVAIRLSPPNQAEVIRRPLMEMTMQLYASPAYLEAQGRPSDISDLTSHRLITYGPGSPQPHETADWLLRQHEVSCRVHMTTNSYAGVFQAAVDGLGIAALPSYTAGVAHGLEVVMPGLQSSPMQVFFVYPEELRRSQRVLAFRDFVLREIESTNRRDLEIPGVAGMS